MSSTSDVAGHAFLCYAREDKEHVDHLQHALEAAGIPVWRDVSDLRPGQDWKMSIRHAVSNDALAFIACFSQVGLHKPKSYQNDELLLAIDQFRQRPPGEPWLIPVRFDDCTIPDLDLGGGRTLASVQHADLFEETLADHTGRLIETILQILGRDPGARITESKDSQRSGLEIVLEKETRTPFSGRALILEIEYRVTNHDAMEYQLYPRLSGPLFLPTVGEHDEPEYSDILQACDLISSRREGERLPARVTAQCTVRGTYVATFAWHSIGTLPDYTLIVSDGRTEYYARPGSSHIDEYEQKPTGTAERERFRTHPYTVVGTIFVFLTLVVTALIWAPWKDSKLPAAGTMSGSLQCPTKNLLTAKDYPWRLRPPSDLTVTWSYSETISGRDEATLHWMNHDPRAVFGLIEVVGRYGTPNPNDEPIVIDGRPLPHSGVCGDWYRRYNSVSQSRTGVFFDSLWPLERYCFAVNASSATGGNSYPYPSVESRRVCQIAPWRKSWGQAARP